MRRDSLLVMVRYLGTLLPLFFAVTLPWMPTAECFSRVSAPARCQPPRSLVKAFSSGGGGKTNPPDKEDLPWNASVEYLERVSLRKLTEDSQSMQTGSNSNQAAMMEEFVNRFGDITLFFEGQSKAGLNQVSDIPQYLDKQAKAGINRASSFPQYLDRLAQSSISRAGGIPQYFDKQAKSGISLVGNIPQYLDKQAKDGINKASQFPQYLDGQAKSGIERALSFTEYLDQRAKAGVSKVEDLTRWADASAKDKIANFTGKTTPYQFGDISKEIIRRIRTGDVTTDDVILVLRITLQIGAKFTPLAKFLPMQILLDVLNVGLAEDFGGRVLEATARELDIRVKEALIGDKSFSLGGIARQQLTDAITKFTGKDTYTFGDIEAMVARIGSMYGGGSGNNKIALDFAAQGELNAWDRQFLQRSNREDAQAAFANWDRKFLEQNVGKLGSTTKYAAADYTGTVRSVLPLGLGKHLSLYSCSRSKAEIKMPRAA